MALATGLYMTGSGVGLALGLAVSAAFETWQAAVLTVVWLVLARDRPKGFTIEGRQVIGVPIKEGLGRAFRSKNMYWLGFSYFLMMGVVMSYIGGLKLVLEKTMPGAFLRWPLPCSRPSR
ncbi:MAG: hypothetical protein SVP26_09845 [Chloroflexota bacterium]|nr:hypothetical protein [Chloroflexota bacterium]